MPAVAAKRFASATARDETYSVHPKPELTAVQLVPLLVERNTPPSVAAKMFVPLTAKQWIEPPKGPLVWFTVQNIFVKQEKRRRKFEVTFS